MILIILLFNFLNGKDIDYKAEKLKLDPSIKSYEFNLEQTISLEENEYVILSTLADAKIFDNGNKLIVADNASFQRIIYNLNTGIIILVNKAGLELQDYYAINNIKSAQLNSDDYKYISSTDYDKYNYNEEDSKRYVTYTKKIQIVEDTLILFQNQFHLPRYKNANNRSTDNRMAITVYDTTFNLINIIPLETSTGVYVIGGAFLYLNNFLYSSSTNYQYKLLEFDSTVTLSKFNLKGNLINNIGYLPKANIDSKLMYENSIPLITNIKEDIFITHPRDKYVYGQNNKIKFELRNLPFSNDSGYKIAYDLFMNYFNNHNTQYPYEERMKIFPISITDMFVRSNNLALLYLVYDYTDKKEYYLILQEYSKDGKIISHTKLYNDIDNTIFKVVYDSKNDYLCFLRKSKKGWTVEKRSFK